MDPNQQFTCHQCEGEPPVFENMREFLHHIGDMIEARKGHMCCPYCKLRHRTQLGLFEHIKQTHPAMQSLRCPGCSNHFRRASHLLRHIENRRCLLITLEDVVRRRKEKTDFIEELNKREGPDGTILFQVGKLNTSRSFAQYIGVPENSGTREYGEPLFSGRVTAGNLVKLHDQQVDMTTPASKPGEILYPHAETDRVEGNPTTETAGTPPGRDMGAQEGNTASIMVPYNPDNPDFNAIHFFDPTGRTYHCPLHCRERFTTPQALVAHMRSSKHVKLHFACPICLQKHNSASGLLTHTESQSGRCHFRGSASYRQFVDQLTGGLIDVTGILDDETIEYSISKDALQKLRAVDQRGYDELEHDFCESYGLALPHERVKDVSTNNLDSNKVVEEERSVW